jgi:hypothetical protein
MLWLVYILSIKIDKKKSYFLPEEINIIMAGAIRGYAAL